MYMFTAEKMLLNRKLKHIMTPICSIYGAFHGFCGTKLSHPVLGWSKWYMCRHDTLSVDSVRVFYLTLPELLFASWHVDLLWSVTSARVSASHRGNCLQELERANFSASVVVAVASLLEWVNVSAIFAEIVEILHKIFSAILFLWFNLTSSLTVSPFPSLLCAFGRI